MVESRNKFQKLKRLISLPEVKIYLLSLSNKTHIENGTDETPPVCISQL